MNEGGRPVQEAAELALQHRPVMTCEWTIGVIPGPHYTGEFLHAEYLDQLTETSWEVHFNSSRTGIRLKGPAPLWMRRWWGSWASSWRYDSVPFESGSIPVLDLTPGIRYLQIHIDHSRITVSEACQKVVEIDVELPPLEEFRVPSRIVRLPLSWDDPATQMAIERYQQGLRPDAPWCPSNLEFIKRINGLDTIDDVKKIVYDANYLILGLGDVYPGDQVHAGQLILGIAQSA